MKTCFLALSNEGSPEHRHSNKNSVPTTQILKFMNINFYQKKIRLFGETEKHKNHKKQNRKTQKDVGYFVLQKNRETSSQRLIRFSQKGIPFEEGIPW